MGIRFCCDKDTQRSASVSRHQSPSRKELINFVQAKGFFSSGISTDIHVNLLAVETEPMEIVENEMRARKYSSAKKSLPKKLTFEDFTVIKKIGEGGFGKVFLVQRKDTEKLYAMKILNKAKLDHVYHRMHTISERQILQNVQSPFIVKLHCAFQNAKNLYLVLEYLPNGSLFDLLMKRSPLDEKNARFYVAEIVLALEDLHSRDIIYRDLKPENILIESQGHIKLTDFGLSKQGVINGTKAYTTCGTAEYLAPEMLCGSGHDKAVDWWSLGCLLYQMLLGTLPHSSNSGNKCKLFKEICNKPINIPETLSAEAQDILKGLLQIDPQKRLKDISTIKKHAFFSGMDWEELREKRSTPPTYPEDLERIADTPKEIDHSNLNSTIFANTNSESFTNFPGFTYYNSMSDLSEMEEL